MSANPETMSGDNSGAPIGVLYDGLAKYEASLADWLAAGREGQFVLLAEGIEPEFFLTLREALEEADRREIPPELSFVDEITPTWPTCYLS